MTKRKSQQELDSEWGSAKTKKSKGSKRTKVDEQVKVMPIKKSTRKPRAPKSDPTSDSSSKLTEPKSKSKRATKETSSDVKTKESKRKRTPNLKKPLVGDDIAQDATTERLEQTENFSFSSPSAIDDCSIGQVHRPIAVTSLTTADHMTMPSLPFRGGPICTKRVNAPPQ